MMPYYISIIVFWLDSDTLASLLSYSSVSLAYFILAVNPHARMFGKTLLHEFLISYGHTEWYLLFSRGEVVFAVAETSPIKI